MTESAPPSAHPYGGPVSANYRSFRARGFRCFEALDLPKLGRINLIVGDNNAGKTSLLEAVYTHAAGYNLHNILQSTEHRGPENVTIYDRAQQILGLFYAGQNELECELDALMEDNVAYKVALQLFAGGALGALDPRTGILGNVPDHPTSNPFSIQMGNQKFALQGSILLGTLRSTINNVYQDGAVLFGLEQVSPAPSLKAARFHDIASFRGEAAVLRVLASMKRGDGFDAFSKQLAAAFPQLATLDLIPHPDGSGNVAHVRDRRGFLLPLTAYGDGLRRWVALVGTLMTTRDTVHCIEEIEATFHPDSQRRLAPVLMDTAKRTHNQVFATSHDLEFVRSFLESLYGGETPSAEEDDVMVYTLKRDSLGALQVWHRNGQETLDNLRNYGVDPR